MARFNGITQGLGVWLWTRDRGPGRRRCRRRGGEDNVLDKLGIDPAKLMGGVGGDIGSKLGL